MSEEELKASQASASTIAAKVRKTHKDAVDATRELDQAISDETLRYLATRDAYGEKRDEEAAKAAKAKALIDAALTYDRPQHTTQASEPEPTAASTESAPQAQAETKPPATPSDDEVPLAFKAKFTTRIRKSDGAHIFDASDSKGDIETYVWNFGGRDIPLKDPLTAKKFPRRDAPYEQEVTLCVIDRDGRREHTSQKIIIPSIDGSTELPAKEETVAVVEDEPAVVETRRRPPHHPSNWDLPEWLAAIVGAFLGGWFLLWLFGNLWTHMFHLHHAHPLAYKVLVLFDVVWDVTLVVAAAALFGLIASFIIERFGTTRQVRS
jgi:hypothetical protein